MTRDEIDALVVRAMATRCGGCDDVDHRMQDALCAEIERLRAQVEAYREAAILLVGSRMPMRPHAHADRARGERMLAEALGAELVKDGGR
jgi:hypothetical protein